MRDRLINMYKIIRVRKKKKMVNKKQIFGWSMYDFANTIFSALFVSVYFPLLVILKGGNAFHVGLAISLSMLLAGLLVPFLGAIADITKRKKFLLFIFTIICCTFTLLAGFFGLVFVLLFGLLANFLYHACLDVYDSLIVDISDKKNIGWISGLGTAVGYLGTLLAVILAYIVGYFYGYETLFGVRLIFILTAVLFFGFSLFLFAFVRKDSKKKIDRQVVKKAFTNVISTIKGIKKYRNVWIFLLASFLYMDAANTTIVFFFLYARDQIGLSISQFLPIYFIMALASAGGAMIIGKITDKIGHKRTLNIVLFLWVAALAVLYFKTTFITYIVIGIVGGMLLGGTWTVTRPLLVSLAPKKKISELFGYQGLTEKFSGFLGPVLYGYIAVAFGFRSAILLVIGFFLLGALVLRFVKK